MSCFIVPVVLSILVLLSVVCSFDLWILMFQSNERFLYSDVVYR